MNWFMFDDLVCDGCGRFRFSPVHWLLKATGMCDVARRW